MGPNLYLNEKASEVHRQELLREADRERLLAQLPQHHGNIIRHAIGKLAGLLLWLGASLKRFEQKSPTILENRP